MWSDVATANERKGHTIEASQAVNSAAVEAVCAQGVWSVHRDSLFSISVF